MLMNKDREILELKGNIAELLAVMPANASIGHSAAPGNASCQPVDQHLLQKSVLFSFTVMVT